MIDLDALDQVQPATISVDAAAHILGISRRHAYYLANNGGLPVIRLGKAIRVPKHRLLALLDGRAGDADD